MTDENLDAGLISAGSDAPVTAASDQSLSSESLGNQADIQQEKMLPQSEVNNIVTVRTRKAYDKGHEAGRAANQTSSTDNGVTANSYHGMNESQVRELVSNQISDITRQQKASLEKQHIEDCAASIYKAIDANAEECKDELPDFKEAMESVDGFVNYPNILMAVHNLPNSAKVLHYLTSDEGLSKLSGLGALSEKAVSARMQKISNRLKQNENGKNSPSAPNPISQIDTNVRDGMGGAEPSSVSDFRSNYKG